MVKRLTIEAVGGELLLCLGSSSGTLLDILATDPRHGSSPPAPITKPKSIG